MKARASGRLLSSALPLCYGVAFLNNDTRFVFWKCLCTHKVYQTKKELHMLNCMLGDVDPLGVIDPNVRLDFQAVSSVSWKRPAGRGIASLESKQVL